MKDLFPADRQVFGDDGFEQALPIFAQAVWAKDIVAIAGDDAVYLQGSGDIGARVFGDEFFIFGAAIVASIAFPAETIPGAPVKILLYNRKRTPVETL